ncbi:MAG: sugar phosphate isomerase/epimerase [Candidatus Sumerlaeota bacterium]|nr:sugar phosphate isomerase/epimerase [Candidatus Sumerlaeota bacterium]
MKLGFVTAILPDLSLEEVLDFARQEGFSCIEAMCWPVGKAERRYAGVTHVDCTNFSKGDANRINDLLAAKGVSLSGLGYYPNPLTPDKDEAKMSIEHIKRVIRASAMLGVNVMNTFIGRDWKKTVDENWPRFLRVWKPLVKFAEDQGVKIGIENCPMLFSNDEWPGGKNLAHSPEIWRRMFEEIPSPNFGLNFDPSHLVHQYIDYVRCIREFGRKFVHVHAKDTRIDVDAVYERGVHGFKWHTPKLPGLGDVNWGQFFSALTDTNYDGPVAIEVEDRAYEGSLELRKAALRQSKRYLEQFQF